MMDEATKALRNKIFAEEWAKSFYDWKKDGIIKNMDKKYGELNDAQKASIGEIYGAKKAAALFRISQRK